ncbi:testis-expressed protein 2-like [Glandiceps talaboti]
MTEKRVPPPRPPAPKLSSLKGSKKTNLPSVSIRYNPLMSQDDDDDLDDEIAIVTEPKKRTSSLQSRSDTLSNSSENGYSMSSKPKPTEKKEKPKPSTLPTKSRSFDRGLITVSAETLEENEEEETKSLFDGIKDAISDPLTFYSKLFEEEAKELEDRPPPSPPMNRRPRSSSARSSNNSLNSRTQSLDSPSELMFGEDALDLVSDHYDTPATEGITFLTKAQSQERLQSPRGDLSRSPPRRAPDSPKRHANANKKPNNITMSFSGLLAHSVGQDSGHDVEVPKLSKQTSDADDSKGDSPVSDPCSDFLDFKLEQPQSPKEDKPLEAMIVPSEPFPFIPVLVVTMLVFAYFILPLPPYIQGVFVGFTMAFFLGSLFIWLMVPSSPKDFPDPPDVNLLPPLRVPVTKPKLKEDEKLLHKGWMNELLKYDPDNYHISHTHSIYVRLEDYFLRLSRPKQNIPRKASWDEPHHNAMFIHQRHFDLRGSKIFLLPEGLCRKRWWSKKYPICIQLAKKGTKAQRKLAESPTDVPMPDNAKGFDIIQREECTDTKLIVFGRTGREKEEWYRKLEIAANWDVTKGKKPLLTLLKDKPSTKIKDDSAKASTDDDTTVPLEDIERTNLKAGVDYYKYMSKLIPKDKDDLGLGVNVKSGGVTYASPARRTKAEQQQSSNESPASWVNALISRSFWDFLREQQWAGVVAHKIQRKLSKIKVPYFINELEITDIDLGIAMPVVRRASKPVMDEGGLWVDLDITYYGSCCMTLETKLNLYKLGKDNGDTAERKLSSSKTTNPNSPSAALDSDEEDSAESSEEEDTDNNPHDAGATDNPESFVGSSTSKKILRIVNRVAKSKYFQKAAENSYIKKAIEEVSNLPLVLTVEVKGLHGTLAVNLPPPPSDRLWYGFRTKPHLWLSARPKLGMRQVTITHVTDWIEKKLEQEFQKVFVMPNMDDLVIPIMDGGMDDSYNQGTEV